MKIIFFLLTLFLSACAATPTPLSESTQVPSDRVFYQQPQLAEHAAKAIFIRDSGYALEGELQNLYINGTPAASVETGERLVLSLVPGEYTFAVQPTGYLGTNASSSIAQSLQADKTYYYRIFSENTKKGTSLSRIQLLMP